VLGAPLVGRVVAHNPSHEKTFALVLAILASPQAWELS
jgi:UDP-3-O-[3-hydroxymyristoyl] N-acetylglucosamine deacetylase